MDELAAEQARENIAASPWRDKIIVHQSTIQQYNSSTEYDVIISNPPFYESSLKSSDSRKNAAKHSSQLSFEELASAVSTYLSNDGLFFILLPYSAFSSFESIARQYNLFARSLVHVKQTPNHSYFRTMAMFCKTPATNVEVSEMNIKDSNTGYSEEFQALLKDYYLAL